MPPIKSLEQVRKEYINLYANYIALTKLSDCDFEYVEKRFGNLTEKLLQENYFEFLTKNKTKVRKELREIRTKVVDCLDRTQLHKLSETGDIHFWPASETFDVDDLAEKPCLNAFLELLEPSRITHLKSTVIEVYHLTSFNI